MLDFTTVVKMSFHIIFMLIRFLGKELAPSVKISITATLPVLTKVIRG
jgi:hypothetical protein